MLWRLMPDDAVVSLFANTIAALARPVEAHAEALDAGDEKELPFVTVCVKGNQISVFGMPVSDEHNCDEMGCSSVEHAIVRGTITALDPGLRAALEAHEGKEKS